MFELAQMADNSELADLWVRDVPLYDPEFGDVGQAYDPFVTLGYLAAVTKNISLGTAGIVTTLREPILTAKQAVSMDQLSKGRFLLRLATGDRPREYPAFNQSFLNRGECFRETWDIITRLMYQSYPDFST
ncbi:LLM class flavin-dependent oxidoreductase [Psittacicella hinzii]|uniref:LLM class flavin-dependent oxidoreductase n=1 Tax=Psittacicella hinzii TaxID=2028575 RepID=UPI001FEA6B4D|nr:LLM class flavin-dependent oxidoreductase [Psittacicella hinzii]